MPVVFLLLGPAKITPDIRLTAAKSLSKQLLISQVSGILGGEMTKIKKPVLLAKEKRTSRQEKVTGFYLSFREKRL